MTGIAVPTGRPLTRAAAIPSRAGRGRALRVTSWVSGAASLLLVTWWWLAAGGLGDLAQPTTALVSLGRIAGLWAADLLLIQVLLMARIPPVEAAFGQIRLGELHRWVGFTSFTLMVTHVLLITWGYAGAALGGFVPTLWSLVTTYPGMLLAAAGTACLVMVVVTSYKAARRRLRYESWHLLHLYAYLGVGLALPHQLWTGQSFLTSPLATAYWWTVWALAAGAVLLWRVALPLWVSARHQLRVTSVVDEGQGVVSIYLTGRELQRLGAEAGQYLQWRFLGRPHWTRAHPFSLSAAPDGRSLRISVKALGDDTAVLRSLRPGTRVLVEGPYGVLTGRPRTRRRVALIGAGIGIAPLRALAEGLDYAPGEAVLLQRFRDQPLFERELTALARERGLQVYWLPGRRRWKESWLGQHAGQADDAAALVHWVPDIAQREVYVCGPEAWSRQVHDSLRRAGLADRFCHVESFGGAP